MFNSTTGGYSLSDIAAATGNGYNRDGFFGGDGGSWWFIVLFILIIFGGWGNNGWGGNGNANGAVPFIMNNDVSTGVQRGFDQSAVMTSLGNITSALSNGFADAEVSRCNSQANVLQTLNNNQMGLYQTLNTNQNATIASMNSLASSLQNCCCENRAGLADVKYTIATEACADRAAVANGVRDILANQTAGIQTILDKLCQQEIDALKTQNSNLQTQLNMANLAASQSAQTATLVQDNNAQTQALINRIVPYPQPSFLVGNPYVSYPYYNNGFNGGCGCSLA